METGETIPGSTNFTKLNEVVGKPLTYSNIDIQSLDWCLTEATQKALNSESCEGAMRNAVQSLNKKFMR
ncbi:hypothetical protein N7537_006035 [Penicillium hordei]|uniref:Uncharacterized protein n=1 Tax=Penicillium hordei TaxID=40994 RepID=A0AAD6E846_9EURO|nr:uncharacterized protein N7537_006035 [Penicillium hordei]KAJ5603079.1 hypothetical protein N7537_006035 [Penicillium hordei]